jgi:drug/metabolite transporter (DMT)-like permease
VPVNPIVSRASLVILIAILGWGLAGYWWARARASTGPGAWIALGLGLAAAPVMTAALIASAYGSAAVPVAMAVLAVAPIMVVIGRDLIKRSRRQAQVA